MELNPLQLLIIGAIASVLGQLLKLLAAKFSQNVLSEKVVTTLVLAVSFVLGAIFMWPQLQPLFAAGDALTIAQNTIAAMGAVAGFAWAIYKYLLESLSDKLKLSQVFMLQPAVEDE